MVCPHLILDKSVLQMLNARELFELNIFFEPIGTPVLTNEIVADLEKPPGKNLVPRDMVKALANKRWASPLEPMHFRKAALGNLMMQDVPMRGATLIDIEDPSVTVSSMGGIHIDNRPVQRIWARWAQGDFRPIEEASAKVLRKGVEGYDPSAVRRQWKPFVDEHFAECQTVEQLVATVDKLLAVFDKATQKQILGITLDLLQAPVAVRHHSALQLFRADDLMHRVKDLAPYAAAITRISLVYVCGIAKDLLKAGPNDETDLQYLFYAPFCHVFASNDHLHRGLWPAVSGPAFFIWGEDLKKDLRRRADLREQNPQRVAGTRPIDLPDSVINAACDRWR